MPTSIGGEFNSPPMDVGIFAVEKQVVFFFCKCMLLVCPTIKHDPSVKQHINFRSSLCYKMHLNIKRNLVLSLERPRLIFSRRQVNYQKSTSIHFSMGLQIILNERLTNFEY